MSANRYTREMYDNFKLRAAWPPNAVIRLGDVGTMETGDRFDYVTNLTALGIAFAEDPPGPVAGYEHATRGAVSLTFKGKGQAPVTGSALAAAHAGVKVDFSQENAVYFRAESARIHRIADQVEVERQIVAARAKGQWQRRWYVVVEVVHAGACTVLISGSRSSAIELEAAGKLGAGAFHLADVTAGLTIRAEREMSTKVVAAMDVTPLLRARRLRWRAFGGTSLEGVRSEEDGIEEWADWTPEDAAS